MGDDIHNLKGLTAFEIDSRDREISARVTENAKDIERHEKYLFGNGKPGLRDCLTEEFDKKLTHNKNNRIQAELLLETLIKRECDDRKWLMSEEKTRVDKEIDRMDDRQDKHAEAIAKMENKLAYYAGGIAALLVLLHFIKA